MSNPIKIIMVSKTHSYFAFIAICCFCLSLIFSGCANTAQNNGVSKADLTQAELAASVASKMEKRGVRLCGPNDGKLTIWSREQSLEVLNAVDGAADKAKESLENADILVSVEVKHLGKEKTWIFAEGWGDKESFVIGPLLADGSCQQHCPNTICSGKKCITNTGCYDDCGKNCQDCRSTCSSDADCGGKDNLKVPEACKGFPLEDLFNVNTTPVEELVPGTSLWSR